MPNQRNTVVSGSDLVERLAREVLDADMNARLTTAVLTVEVMSDIDNSLRRSERDISMLREGAPFGAMSASRTAGERPPYRTASELLVDHIERYLDYCEWD